MDYESECVAVRIDKFQATLKRLLTYVPKAHNILDIGAATGEFLSVARKQGLWVSGIELSSYAAGKAKDKHGFDFHRVGIEDYHGDEKYDLIHMNHVFEHFISPHAVLERIELLLNPGGMVYVEVPFQFSLFEVIKYLFTQQRKSFDVFSVHHAVFYRPRTLIELFKAHGFNCRELRVFDWSRYPSGSLVCRLKRLMWLAASSVGQGIMIEGYFERGSQKRDI
jgi:2-polyprenyl-3-methyl-5-hydroxy-6-metoxy-1,4-benzoquinol methylase